MFRLVFVVVLALVLLPSSWLQGSFAEDQIATEQEVQPALEVFGEWTAAYQAGDYIRQWHLTDFRIRKWHDKKRWKKMFRRSVRKTGKLLSFKIVQAGEARAENLPCTEMGHCYRRDVPVVVLIIESQYSGRQPQQPEYVIMAHSEEGWRFGGGTFPNLPRGETMVILDRKDELRYQSDLSGIK